MRPQWQDRKEVVGGKTAGGGHQKQKKQKKKYQGDLGALDQL